MIYSDVHRGLVYLLGNVDQPKQFGKQLALFLCPQNHLSVLTKDLLV